jgi:FkbM family methyltransferase
MAGSHWTFHVEGHDLEVAGEAFGLARELYGRRPYFAAPGFDLGRDDVVVDLGANAGLFTVLAAKLASRVVAVEAQSGYVAKLRENLARHGCSDQVAVEFAAVGAGAGLFGTGRLRREAHYSDEPRISTMDELVARHGLARIDFLKIDVEGSEFDLFAHDTGWLDVVDRLAMEVHTEFGSPAELAAALRARGFAVRLMEADMTHVARIAGTTGYVCAWRPAREPEAGQSGSLALTQP